MRRWELLFPSKYLKGADFAQGPQVLTIKAVVQEEVASDRGKEVKGLVYFEEILDKALILNVTNAKSIVAMYGPDLDDWPGKKVELYMGQTNGKGGEVLDCVRVRKGIPAQKGAKK